MLITDFGAVPDGTTVATEAIRAAIEACHASGGGHVVVPEGTFLTGAVHLLSNVDLHLAEGSTLKFLEGPEAYFPLVYTRFQGIEPYNYSPFIYAFEQENIGVTGSRHPRRPGLVVGIPRIQRTRSAGRADRVRPAAADGGARPARRAADIRERDHGTQRSSAVPLSQRGHRRHHHQRVPVLGDPPRALHNVTIHNVAVNTFASNNDGCDPEFCSDVVIQGCRFNTHDDCIAVKSGRDYDGRRVDVPCENIVIRNCNFAGGQRCAQHRQ